MNPRTNIYKKNASKRRVVSGRCKYCNKPIKGIKIKEYCDNKCRQAEKNSDGKLAGFLKQGKGQDITYHHTVNDTQSLVISSEGNGAGKRWTIIFIDADNRIPCGNTWLRLGDCKKAITSLVEHDEPLQISSDKTLLINKVEQAFIYLTINGDVQPKGQKSGH